MFKSEEPCKGCHNTYYIQNKKDHLCGECIFKRNHNGKTRFEVYKVKQKSKPQKKYHIGKSKKRNEVLERDRKAYRYWFDNKVQRCEECDNPLPNVFEDDEGNMIAIWRYSHILSKGAWNQFRYHKLNCNILCLECHNRYEFGDRKSMKIFEMNEKIIEEIKKTPNNFI